MKVREPKVEPSQLGNAFEVRVDWKVVVESPDPYNVSNSSFGERLHRVAEPASRACTGDRRSALPVSVGEQEVAAVGP